MRGEPALEILPKLVVVFRLAEGLPKFGRLSALKNSARNCRLARSLTRKFFITPMSRLARPGPRSRFRGAVPKVPSALGANADVLKYCETRSFRGRLVSR